MLLLVSVYVTLFCQNSPPVIGLSIAAPDPDGLDQFISFMEEELAPGGINILVLRVDFNYSYESYPVLRDENPLRRKHVKKLVRSARKHGMICLMI